MTRFQPLPGRPAPLPAAVARWLRGPTRRIDAALKGPEATGPGPDAVADRWKRLGYHGPGPDSPRLLEQIIGRNMLMPVGYLEAGWRASRAVGRVVVVAPHGTVAGFGTGFLVGPRVLMTNHHVLPDIPTARASRVEFGYQRDADGALSAGTPSKLAPDLLFLTSPEDALDFTVVALADEPPGLGYHPLIAGGTPVLAGDCLTIIQHPRGEPKQVALRENQVIRLPGDGDPFLHYQTSTLPGSSGSPVFNDAWEVIALHHSGKPATDPYGRVLNLDGGPWDPSMGPDRIRWVANEGIRIHAIVDEIRRQKPSREAAAMIAPAQARRPATTAGSVAIPELARGRPGFDDRDGYDPGFLGFNVPLPRMAAGLRAEALVPEGSAGGRSRHVLPYHHFSLVMHRRRRLAIFTAVNLDGNQARAVVRKSNPWAYDGRIDRSSQVGADFYAKPFDRGHLVRRIDPCWGTSESRAREAADDTFYYTNSSPQHELFNEGKNLWAGLEDFLLQAATRGKKRMSVFTGPVLAADDPLYRGVAIPRQFWKVAVAPGGDGKPVAMGFLASQADLIRSIMPGPEIAPAEVARAFQVPIAEIEAATGLGFGQLRSRDPMAPSIGNEAAGLVRIALEDYSQIRMEAGR
ncbi:MAG: DNA/RNA non-specific endonuclease [Isosphaeraceae bacterium]